MKKRIMNIITWTKSLQNEWIARETILDENRKLIWIESKLNLLNTLKKTAEYNPGNKYETTMIKK